MTNESIFDFDQNKEGRQIPLQNLRGLTKSFKRDNHDFIVHVEVETLEGYDHHIRTGLRSDRDEAIAYIKAAYFDKMETNLPIYGVVDQVTQFETTQS